MYYLLQILSILLSISVFLSAPCIAQTSLIVHSKTLDLSLQVNIRETGENENKPIFYITDGQEFLNRKVDLFLDSLTLSGNVPSAYYVFVGSTNLKSHTNERNKLFFCNADFLNFFENTLIPMVERQIGQTFIPAQRGLLGISFGGLNAAYFAAKGHAFKRFGLLSPITYPCREINQSILFSDRSNLRLFISTGTNDAEQYTQELIPLFQSKGHTVQTLQTPGNHDFENWLEQLPKAIRFLADH